MSLRSEFLTSNIHTAFPFKENTDGVVYPPTAYQHGLTATISPSFMVDALISVPDNITSVVLYSIERVAISLWRLRFADMTGTVILTYDLTALPTFAFDTFDVLKIYNELLRCSMTFVVAPIFNTYLNEIVVGNTDSFGITLVFESAIVNTLPPRLTAFTIDNGIDEYAGKLKLIGGYNIEISNVVALNDITELTIDIVPGIGTGLAPCISNTVPKLMSVIPDAAGNVEIRDANGCYNIVPHQVNKTIEIQGDCYQCCTCAQYVNVGLAIKNLINRADLDRINLLAFQEKLNTTITSYNTQLDSCTKTVNFYASGRKYSNNRDAIIIVGFINRSSQYDLVIDGVSIVSPAAVISITPPGNTIPFTVPKGQTNTVIYTLQAGAPIEGEWTATVGVAYEINTQIRNWSKTFVLL